jgi:hypothetical protein
MDYVLVDPFCDIMTRTQVYKIEAEVPKIECVWLCHESLLFVRNKRSIKTFAMP